MEKQLSDCINLAKKHFERYLLISMIFNCRKQITQGIYKKVSKSLDMLVSIILHEGFYKIKL